MDLERQIKDVVKWGLRGVGLMDPAEILVTPPETYDGRQYSDSHVCYKDADGRGVGVYDADQLGTEDLTAKLDFETAGMPIPGTEGYSTGHCGISFNGASGADLQGSYVIRMVERPAFLDELQPSEAVKAHKPAAHVSGWQYEG